MSQAKKEKLQKYIKTLRVVGGKKVDLKQVYQTNLEDKMFSKEEGLAFMEAQKKEIAALQDMLYAHNEYSLLIVIQAMDAAGKDGAIEHVMSGLNPTSVKVASFKAPTRTELEHDYFWRHYLQLPARGEIGIFNRSHYENVLVTRVHPEYILSERIAGIDTLKDIDQAFWEGRFQQINRFEKNLVENGTIIIKFFLHVSKEEQKARFIDRIDDPEKNWKFALADVEERKHWDEYMTAYAEMLSATSTQQSPWFAIPADSKWFARLCITNIILQEFSKLKMEYPRVSKETKAKLQEIKQQLLAE